MTTVGFATRFVVAFATTLFCAAAAHADEEPEPGEPSPAADTPGDPGAAPAEVQDAPLAPPPPAPTAVAHVEEKPAAPLPPAIAGPPAATTIAPAPATVAANRPDARRRPLHEVAFGVRAGATRLALDASRLSTMKLPMDDLRFEGLTVTPTFSFGGDGYFFRLDLPFTKADTFTGYGLGLYPINYGHLFRTTGLFPYLSAGVAGSMLFAFGQGLSGGLGQVRVAIGFRLFLVSGLALSAEAGFVAYGAGVLVDQRRVKEIKDDAVAGAVIDLSPGMRPASGGAGSGFDFAVGFEWL